MTNAPIRCTHCGLVVPPRLVRPNTEHQFCCSGCESVYGVLHSWGCEDYYRLRAAAGPAPQPAHVTGRRFDELDDPTATAELVRPTAGGTCETQLYLEGVHCAACVWLVEQLPTRHDGLRRVRLDLGRGVADVEWDPSATSLASVARDLDALGYVPHPYRQRDRERLRRAEDRALLKKLGVAAAGAMNVMVIQAALYAGEAQGMERGFFTFFRWICLLVALPVMLYSARPFFATAWGAIRQRSLHIDLPIAIALLGAFAASAWATVVGHGEIYFDSVTALVALLLGARYVQGRAQRAALSRAETLRGAAFAEFARRIDDDGATREVPSAALAPGQRVEVRSGELVPADGVVLLGASDVDNAVLTGEAHPVRVGVGDAVSAGATNLGAALVVGVQAVGSATRVGGLLRLVEEAAAARPPILRVTDRVARVFVMAVLALAAAAGTYWAFAAPGELLERAVALLVVACPCALALGTPVAITVALSRAAARGIFVKDADVFEKLRSVRDVLLDKTGTLTTGRPRVVAWRGDADALALAGALERQSVHPTARALAAAAPADRHVGAPDDVREVAGRGIGGRVDGRAVAVGNRAYLQDLGVVPGAEWDAEAAAQAGRGASPTFVVVDGAVRGLAAIGDVLRDEAVATVAALVRRGMRPAILSGDDARLVQLVAAEVGIAPEDAHGGLSPEEKHARVVALAASARAAQRRVLVVGDGVNDAAALAAADVGVAVQGGSAAAAVAADVVLGRAGLTPLLELVRGAAMTRRVIWRNLSFSLIYNAVGISLAVVGAVGPLLAAVLMPLSSLTVILSSVLGGAFGAPDRRLSAGRVAAAAVGG